MIARTNVKAYFSLFGDDFPLDDVSLMLDTQPTETRAKGQLSRNNTIINETSWTLGTEYEESLDVSEQLNKIVKRLIHKVDTINQLQQNYNLRCKFVIVIKIEDGMTPSLFFDQRIIEIISKLKAEIDIDLYANPYRSEFEDG